MSPEAVQFGVFSVQSDLWSYGIVLYEIITFGAFPYGGLGDVEVVERVKRMEFNITEFLPPSAYDTPVWRLIDHCCQYQWQHRPASVQQVIDALAMVPECVRPFLTDEPPKPETSDLNGLPFQPCIGGCTLSEEEEAIVNLSQRNFGLNLHLSPASIRQPGNSVGSCFPGIGEGPGVTSATGPDICVNGPPSNPNRSLVDPTEADNGDQAQCHLLALDAYHQPSVPPPHHQHHVHNHNHHQYQNPNQYHPKQQIQMHQLQSQTPFLHQSYQHQPYHHHHHHHVHHLRSIDAFPQASWSAIPYPGDQPEHRLIMPISFTSAAAIANTNQTIYSRIQCPPPQHYSLVCEQHISDVVNGADIASAERGCGY
ncbi:unnamed protein product, partial [Protopolystoma xenopodis]